VPFSFLVLVALSFAAAGCDDSPTSPNNQPFSQTELRIGTGADATTGRVLTVHYTGWLFDALKPGQKGAQFDSSVGSEPFVFQLGAGFVIAGWDQGLQGMKVGGVRRLVVPSSLGYGSLRSGPIPPYATMLFEIELLEVQ
jgi:FKBP-type peptidyl-prolyl cis-trans isomerase FkpA